MDDSNVSRVLPSVESETEEFKLSDIKFSPNDVIGEGGFAIVYRGFNKQDQTYIAVKKAFVDTKYNNRELDILKSLTHPNIITFKNGYYTTENEGKDTYLNIVMELMESTTGKIISSYTDKHQKIPLLQTKLYTYQLFRALAYLHARNICHRDIKPHNLLVNQDNLLKLCDFGTAKTLNPLETNLAYMCSRYYRAPELIFGSSEYSFPIDIWGAGCVLAEFLLGRPLFTGESGADQLIEIMKILGTPTRQQLNSMNPNYSEYKFPHLKVLPLARSFPEFTEQEGIELLSLIFVYSPQERPSALECLQHPFFDSLRSINVEKSRELGLFHWTEEENSWYPQEIVEKLTPNSGS